MHETGFYYDLLAPHAGRVDLWETEYIHIMPGAEAILEWYRGTGLRPVLAGSVLFASAGLSLSQGIAARAADVSVIVRGGTCTRGTR